MKKIKRGTGITQREIIESEDFSLHFEHEEWMEKRLGREPGWFDWQACAVEAWAEEILKATPGALDEKLEEAAKDFARRVLECAAQTRLEIDRGRTDRAAYHAIEFGRLVAEITIKGLFGKRLDPFLEPKDGHTDKLSKLMFKEFEMLKKHKKKPTARDVWNRIKAGHDARLIKFIDYMDDEIIEWEGCRGDRTTFHDFEKRLTTIRKKLKK